MSAVKCGLVVTAVLFVCVTASPRIPSGRSLVSTDSASSPGSSPPAATLLSSTSVPGPQTAPTPAILPEGPAEVVAVPPGVAEPALDLASLSQSSNQTSVSVKSANTIGDAHCGVPSCGQTCSDYTTSNAVAFHNQNYLWYGTQSTCTDWNFPFVHPQYQQCCVQTCSADSDCPSSYYCQGGWNVNGGSVCTLCNGCSTTTNTKCQLDQKCQFSCCLSPDPMGHIGCLAPGLPLTSAAISGDMCCPSMPSSFPGGFVQNGYSISCHCNTRQTCTLPSPPPSPSPPPPPPASPPPPPPVDLAVTTRIRVKQTLPGFDIALWSLPKQALVVGAISSNLAKLYGNVSVAVISVTSGSVVMETATTLYSSNHAAAYEELMSRSSTGPYSVYYPYTAIVDTSSITTLTGSPPSPSSPATTSTGTAGSPSTSGAAPLHNMVATIVVSALMAILLM